MMNENNKITIYQTPDGSTQLDVRLENETVWLSQQQMSVLFQKDRTVITRHINNIFKEGELDPNVVCADFAHATKHGAIEGKTQIQKVVLYNLDVIISVGTLSLAVRLPLLGRVRDLHPLDYTHVGRTRKKRKILAEIPLRSTLCA